VATTTDNKHLKTFQKKKSPGKKKRRTREKKKQCCYLTTTQKPLRLVHSLNELRDLGIVCVCDIMRLSLSLPAHTHTHLFTTDIRDSQGFSADE
jgi:hypothetical protein